MPNGKQPRRSSCRRIDPLFPPVLSVSYQFAGISRINLFWANPNATAAVLVEMLPFVWQGSTFRPKIVRFGAGALEVSLYYALARTYSRGGIIAAIGACWVYHRFSALKERPCGVRDTGVRLLVAVAIVGCTHEAKRLSPHDIISDPSVTNRISLWKAGSEMIAAAPMRGWGKDESGTLYMNWYEAIDRGEGYFSMVNSYLTVAVEHGIGPVFLAIMGFGCFIGLEIDSGKRRPNDQGRSGRDFSAACKASIAAWAIANAFSTLYVTTTLWLLPMLAMGGLTAQVLTGGARNLKRCGMVAGASAASLLLLVLIYGCIAASFERLQLKLTADHVLEVARTDRANPNRTRWFVWPDSSVMGRSPGKEIRRWVLTDGRPITAIVLPTVGWRETRKFSDCHLLLCGRQAERMDTQVDVARCELWLICPIGRVPDTKLRFDRISGSRLFAVFGSLDDRGENQTWIKWCRQAGGTIIVKEGVGPDIRSEWPALIEP